MIADFAFPAGAPSVARARHAVSGTLGDLPDEVVQDATLLISELVTNSVRHAGATDGLVHVHVDLGTDRLRVEVRDGGAGFSPPEQPSAQAAGGWGLVAVSRLSDRWGSRQDRGEVWFEIDL
jgi:signal transduction histidine kinase